MHWKTEETLSFLLHDIFTELCKARYESSTCKACNCWVISVMHSLCPHRRLTAFGIGLIAVECHNFRSNLCKRTSWSAWSAFPAKTLLLLWKKSLIFKYTNQVVKPVEALSSPVRKLPLRGDFNWVSVCLSKSLWSGWSTWDQWMTTQLITGSIFIAPKIISGFHAFKWAGITVV